MLDSMPHGGPNRPVRLDGRLWGKGNGDHRRGIPLSAATTVRETRHQDAGDARDQLRRTGTAHLLWDSGIRFRAADGTSYARALGHSSLLTLIPAVIAVIGLVTTFDMTGFRGVARRRREVLRAGPGRLHPDRGPRGCEPSSGPMALVAGLAGMLLSGTVGMTHLERAANRIYGVDEGRGARQWWLLAFVLAATVGVMLMVGLAVIVAGGSVGEGSSGSASQGSGLWSVIRWPIGVALVTTAMTIILKVVPNRRQPGFSWLLSGTAVSVVVWVLATILLGFFYEHATVLGGSFGPLLGIIALLVWAYATGIAVPFGLACAAQLEAERAGERRPVRAA
jgi:uncharacterized BrkB/YihY/UPF0761 family membrane protein